MAIHSSIFAWKIPWTKELGKLQSLGCKETQLSTHTHYLYLKEINLELKFTFIVS